MQGKAARRLRKLISQEAGFLPEVEYQEVNKSVKLYPVGVNPDGTVKQQAVEVSTRELGSCQRSLYQSAKRLHHHYTFH